MTATLRNRGWEEPALRKVQTRQAQEPTDLSAARSYAQMCAARGYTDRVSELVEQILAMDMTNGFARGERLARSVLEERIDDAMVEYELRNRLEPLAFPLRLEQARLMMRNERCDEAIRQCNLALDI